MEDFDKLDLLKSDQKSELEKEPSKLKEYMQVISKKKKTHLKRKMENKLREVEKWQRKFEEEDECNPEDLPLL